MRLIFYFFQWEKTAVTDLMSAERYYLADEGSKKYFQISDMWLDKWQSYTLDIPLTEDRTWDFVVS